MWSKRVVLTGTVAVALFALTASLRVTAAQDARPVTFHKDVLPILQKNCQSCHRPGRIAPMSLLTFNDARPWAKAMKAAVVTKKMPPWFADPQVGHFANERALKSSEIDIISGWADGGAQEGNLKDAPAPIRWPAEGWEIEPDLIVNGPEFSVPANPKNNVIEWAYITVPSGVTKDTWVTSMEIRPSEPSVTHHICVYFKPHTADVVYNKPLWTDKARDENGSALPSAVGPGRGSGVLATVGTNGIEGCY